jgi:hypothetical protein
VRGRHGGRTIGAMGHDSTYGVTGLAPVYARVLTLRAEGLSDEAIAIALGVTIEAVPALIEVAARKRANHRDSEMTAGEDRAT